MMNRSFQASSPPTMQKVWFPQLYSKQRCIVPFTEPNTLRPRHPPPIYRTTAKHFPCTHTTHTHTRQAGNGEVTVLRPGCRRDEGPWDSPGGQAAAPEERPWQLARRGGLVPPELRHAPVAPRRRQEQERRRRRGPRVTGAPQLPPLEQHQRRYVLMNCQNKYYELVLQVEKVVAS
jgi:hypothetical protein